MILAATPQKLKVVYNNLLIDRWFQRLLLNEKYLRRSHNPFRGFNNIWASGRAKVKRKCLPFCGWLIADVGEKKQQYRQPHDNSIRIGE